MNDRSDASDIATKLARKAYELAGPRNDAPYTAIGFARASGATLGSGSPRKVRELRRLAKGDWRTLLEAKGMLEQGYPDDQLRWKAMKLLDEAATTSLKRR